MTFDYQAAFSRNLGLIEPEEQQRIRNAKVAIAGLGGVGGQHAVTLARMGIGKFHIADFDEFEVHNFNRQVGATCSTLGQKKSAVMERMIRDINPTAEVSVFPAGVQQENMSAFLAGVDVVIDGLDYFAVAAREQLYRGVEAARLPAVAAGPIGCSAALLVFLPGQMSWHEYFAMDLARDVVDKYILFAIGTAPAATQMSYMNRKYINLEKQYGPSLALAIQLCAGVTAAEVMKIVLKRGPIQAAPICHQFDAYKCKYVKRKLRWGNRGPWQRLKFFIFKKLLAKQAQNARTPA